MTKIIVTHCKNCPLGQYHYTNGLEQYVCNHPDQDGAVVLTSSAYNTDSLDDREIPDECPLFKDQIEIRLDMNVQRPYNEDAEFDRNCDSADSYIKSRKE